MSAIWVLRLPNVFTISAETDRKGRMLVDRADAKRKDLASGDKLVLRPLIGLMNGLNPDKIERFVVEEIEKHRRLRDEAVRLETLLDSDADQTALTGNRRAYISAMIAVHAQQTVVSTLLDILGYIPEIPKTTHR
ncbi:transcriptional repressor TraM [Rhizobium sp. NLR22b]|uniref:transcriptional repressor TraM n=1 Tax=Rhizobium sp. NLR22b TaxID=2731115 RepID=UPI001C83A511|nr:transcriptional repressor TraM [Rhizobium sp. NLR22b]MBX5241988.1 transcriptional regulator [Rhizobium sp. NLR22b]